MKKTKATIITLIAALLLTACSTGQQGNGTDLNLSEQSQSSGVPDSVKTTEEEKVSDKTRADDVKTEEPAVETTVEEEPQKESIDWDSIPYADELDFEVEDIDGGVKIINYLGSDTVIKIPETIDGKKVLAISRAVYYENKDGWDNITNYGFRDLSGDKTVKPALGGKITHVNIPDGVTDIAYAFYGCKSLAEVNIPSSLTVVSEGAFYNCSSLSDITIPNTVTEIGRNAFFSCGIESITIPDSIKEIRGDFIMRCGNLKEVNLPEKITLLPGSEWEGTVYGSITLDGCGSLTNTDFVKNIIPADNIDSLGISYDWCNSLTSITYPEGVDSVGSFNSCINLTEITIPDSVTSVGGGNYFTFAGCKNLKKVTLPDNLETIYENAFVECPEDLEIVYQGKTYKSNQVPNLLKAVNGQ